MVMVRLLQRCRFKDFSQIRQWIFTATDSAASYIAGWLKALKADPKLVVNAAARAQKAADHILSTTKPTE